MPTEALKRLIARIEALSGLELSQRASEIEQWLRSRAATTEATEAAIDRFSETLLSADSSELSDLLCRFTVSYTRFFRDAEQLAGVAAALAGMNRRPARLWVAGCSTGEEAYTMALFCREHGCEVEIVASDINRESLEHGRAARYPREVLKQVPAKHHADFVDCGSQVELSPRIRRRVTFVEHSLMQPPLRPLEGPGWDLILCRNVLIYFRAELSEKTLAKLASAVAPGGYVVLGTSEFHLRTSELLPTRLAERSFLQRPLHPPLHLELDQCLEIGSAESPKPLVTNVSPKRTNSAAALVRLLFSGNHDAVLKEALPILMRDAEQQPMLLLSGIAYHMKGRHYEAAAVLEKTLGQHPTCWPAAYFLAASLEALSRSDEALAIYRAIDGERTPTAAAQALIDLLDLQPWKSEVMALARRRLTGSFDRISPQGARRDSVDVAEKGEPHASHSS